MTHSVLYADLCRPAGRVQARLYDVVLTLSASWLLALSAQLAFRIGPVPLTAQTFAVTLTGALLGSRRGALAVLAYLAQGAAGMPFFANGAAGLPYMLGPTGGYLLGFAGAAWLTGFLAERGWDRHLGRTLAMMTLGHGVIFAGGLLWLTVLVGASTAIKAGLLPFLPGCILKVCLAAAVLPGGWKLTRFLEQMKDNRTQDGD